MYENCNLFLFLIEINNMHSIRHILPIPGPVFGAGAVFRDIGTGKAGKRKREKGRQGEGREEKEKGRREFGPQS